MVFTSLSPSVLDSKAFNRRRFARDEALLTAAADSFSRQLP